MPDRSLRIGFRTSIIAIFVGTVLFVGLSLVYLSFERVGAITRTAAASFLDTVAQLSADRIDAQFMAVRDGLDILQDLPSVRSAAVRDNPRLYALLASMLRNNRQLYSLYAGYDDGRFVQMDYLERGGETARLRTEAPDGAQFRLVVIPDSGGASTIDFLRDDLSSIKRRPGPTDYDPRRRPWYTGAFEKDLRPLTEPYIFFAIGQPGYTLRMPIAGSPRGVVAGDILTGEAEALLRRQQLGRSGMVVLFDDENRVLAHPQISELMARNGGTAAEVVLPKLADVDRIGIARAIDAWKKTGSSQQIFEDAGGRVHAAAFRTIASAGPANLRLAVSAPVDEFYSQIEAERRRLFLTALGFVLAVLPIVLWMGTMMSKRMRALAVETDSIRHFDLLETPRIRSVVREIDDLGRSIAAMKNLVRTFSNFIPKRLVRELVESEVPIELGGERRELTILFTDVENFTSLTEAAEPTSVMRMTSRYFSALSEEIMARQGTVDKFIGDAVMAFWNAPNEDERHVSNACRAVLACVEANRRLNVDFAAEGLPPFRTRFGLHVGDVVVGNIGSRDRKPGRILGHEGIGIVDEVGVAVTDFKPGDRVLISCISSCGKCDYCRRGIYSHCRTGGWILGNQINGTQAEYVRTPHADTSLYHLPPGIDEEALVMLSDILPTGFECGVLNGKVAPGSTVAIVGAGPVGLAALLTAQFYTPAGKRHPANDRNGFDPISGCHDAGALDRPA